MPWKKFVLAAVLVLAVVLVGFFGTLYASAWYYRWQAHRMLRLVEKMQPGVLAQSQFYKVMEPFEKYLGHGSESVAGRPTITTDDYGVMNYPAWLIWLSQHLTQRQNKALGHLVLPGTLFSISPRFANGKLSVLHISEYQDGVDGIHPFVARVSIYDEAAEQSDPRFEHRPFPGYEVDTYVQSREDAQGNSIGPSWTIRQYIRLDDRASHQERTQALEFQLNCFTSFRGCKDAHKILQPAPNR